jgi:hypothetical protein
MASIQHEITVQEAVKLSGLTRRQITYAASTGKLSTRKLPGRTGAYLLNLDEVRRRKIQEEFRSIRYRPPTTRKPEKSSVEYPDDTVSSSSRENKSQK